MIPRGVPALPPHLQLRLDQVARLEQIILADAMGPATVERDERVTAIVRIGGAGKSTFSATFCGDSQTRRSFTDGIVWLSVGHQPDMFALMARLTAPFANLLETVSMRAR